MSVQTREDGREGGREKRGKHARNVQVATKTRVTKARIGADKDENIGQETIVPIFLALKSSRFGK